MREVHIRPSDYYLSFPHLRLSKRKYLILENGRLCIVRTKNQQSKVTFYEYINQIRKMEVKLVKSRYGSYLAIFFLPAIGRKKAFRVSPLEGFSYKDSDWLRVIKFFKVSGFKPHKYPDREKAIRITKPINMDARVWFSPYDKIFQLYKDPEFMKELTKLKMRTWPTVLTTSGFLTLAFGIVYLFTFYDLLFLWLILLIISLSLIILGLPVFIKDTKTRKELENKHDLEYHFR